MIKIKIETTFFRSKSFHSCATISNNMASLFRIFAFQLRKSAVEVTEVTWFVRATGRKRGKSQQRFKDLKEILTWKTEENGHQYLPD